MRSSSRTELDRSHFVRISGEGVESTTLAVQGNPLSGVVSFMAARGSTRCLRN